MTTIQLPESRAQADVLAKICESYAVAKLVQTTFDHTYVVYYRKDHPYAPMSQFFGLEAAIGSATSQPAHLISAGAPCVGWPNYQKAIANGTILYQC